MSWAGQYVGIPFADGQLDNKGTFCWGLIYLVYKEQLGIELDPYLNDCSMSEAHWERKISEEAVKDWVLVSSKPSLDLSKIREFDVIIIEDCIAGVWMKTHLGIVAPSGKLLHTTRRNGSSCVDIKRTGIFRRFAECWRHRNMR